MLTKTRVAFTGIFSVLLAAAAISISAGPAAAVDRPVTTQDTARLLGYMFGDGTEVDGVWDVNGPSGASSLIEELVELHGGTWVNRSKLRFRLSAPYDWSDWKDGLPDDSAAVRAAVQDPNFLAAVLEVEGSVTGLIYDQSACCVDGFTIGRLTELRDLLVDQGYRTTSLTRFNEVNSGRIDLDPAEFAALRSASDFVCPNDEAAIRVPGGTKYGAYGDLQWIEAGDAWGDVVRTDCRPGEPVPAPTTIQGSCTAVANGNEVTLSWTFTLGDAMVRRNNNFIENVAGRDGSWSETRPNGAYRYDIRLFAFGVRTDVSCGSVSVPGDGVSPPVDAPCVVVDAGGGQVALWWDDFGANKYFVRKNGKWVKTVTGSLTTSTAGSIDDTWVVRYFSNGSRIDVPCSDRAGDNGPCQVSASNQGVRVTWDPVAGISKYQVRVNGSWRAAVTDATFYDDPAGSLADRYVIRYSRNGTRVDLACD